MNEKSVSTPLTWKTRIFLVGFGAVVALISAAVVLQFVSFGPKGTEFNSIDDVRRAMIKDDAPSEDLQGSGSQPVSLRAIVRPHPNDRLIYTLRPNLDLQFVRAHVQTNACGMRSPERPLVKEAGTYRIALLGDSFTFGWGVEQKESFAQVLEDTLNAMIKRNGSARIKRVEVLNFGVPGYSTFQEVTLLKEVGVDFDPDAVLVYFVQNDFGMPFFIHDVSGSGGILSSLKFVQLGKQLFNPNEMNQQIEALGLDPNRALRELADFTSERGIQAFLTINPRKTWRSDLSRLWSLKGSNIQLLPLRDGLLEYIERHHIPEEQLTLSFDPHPSPIRHNILGNLLASYFAGVVL